MARIEPVPFAAWSAEMGQAVKALASTTPKEAPSTAVKRPRALNALGTLAHHPVLAKAFFGLNGHLMNTTTLSERDREILVLRVAAIRRSGYEWAQHHFIAQDIGLTADEIARIAFGSEAPFWSAFDAALLRAAEEMIQDGGISAQTWATLAGELDTRQMLDVIFTVNGYDAFARMLSSCQVDLDDDLSDLREV